MDKSLVGSPVTVGSSEGDDYVLYYMDADGEAIVAVDPYEWEEVLTQGKITLTMTPGENEISAVKATFDCTLKSGDKLKNWKFGVSMEMPSVDGTTNNDLSINTQRMPDFATSVQYNWNSSSHVKLGAILRSMTYSSNVHEKAYSATGFGLQASTTFNITKKLQAFGQFNYGKGIGSYLNDLSNLNVDIVPDPDNEGKMQVLPMLGWYAGLQYNLCPSIFISGTYSLSRLYSENGYPSENPESYRKGQYLVANAFWNVSSNLQVGVEYLRGWRTDFSSSTRHANRLNMLVQYSF